MLLTEVHSRVCHSLFLWWPRWPGYKNTKMVYCENTKVFLLPDDPTIRRVSATAIRRATSIHAHATVRCTAAIHRASTCTISCAPTQMWSHVGKLLNAVSNMLQLQHQSCQTTLYNLSGRQGADAFDVKVESRGLLVIVKRFVGFGRGFERSVFG